ncbi:hypothetical protein [Thermanaeromonas sp. C210]|uniref:ribonuclease toxin HepT-like protein n=1 Tax=Thermanaeromonas sp. C210 TaxID=2731925 RepID=UPI00155B42BA|nr:hypothetical protein [Thermanaeromonas sp. C210]GFN24291.1 hypothetical protein TAMC210_26090 [Thermanaeromonas sp. C210]
MKKKYLALAGRIREEIVEIKQAVDRARNGWDRYKLTGDDFYLDSVAFNLHSFYTGLERIFELIAVNVEQSKPEGENWHQELLRQMAVEIELIRPPVISRETRISLDEYRGFRHVVRNVYTFHLSPARIEPLLDNLPRVFDRAKKEMECFLSFLEARGQEKE